jgi:hypothetical protein
MDYHQNLKAFLNGLTLKMMSGHQKFLAVAAIQSRGKTNVEVTVKQVKKQWRKSLLHVKHNPAFYDRAEQEGWVNPVGWGRFLVTEAGLDHLSALTALEDDHAAGELKKSGSLVIVNRRGTHSFDKYLRGILAGSKDHVLIVDPYVDGTIFDSVLDVIPKTTNVKLIYAHKKGHFDQRAKRFSQEYQRFHSRKFKWLHDRFIVVDDAGYILGPSIKDAASNYPALVTVLDSKGKDLLQSFFDELWSKAN